MAWHRSTNSIKLTMIRICSRAMLMLIHRWRSTFQSKKPNALIVRKVSKQNVHFAHGDVDECDVYVNVGWTIHTCSMRWSVAETINQHRCFEYELWCLPLLVPRTVSMTERENEIYTIESVFFLLCTDTHTTHLRGTRLGPRCTHSYSLRKQLDVKRNEEIIEIVKV